MITDEKIEQAISDARELHGLSNKCKHSSTLRENIDRISIEKCEHCKAFRRIGFWDRWHDNFTENISKWLNY